jgi:hypothetical protein
MRTPNAGRLCWGTGVTPYATIPGGWTTDGRIALVLDDGAVFKAASNEFLPDPVEPEFAPPDVES